MKRPRHESFADASDDRARHSRALDAVHPPGLERRRRARAPEATRDARRDGSQARALGGGARPPVPRAPELAPRPTPHDRLEPLRGDARDARVRARVRDPRPERLRLRARGEPGNHAAGELEAEPRLERRVQPRVEGAADQPVRPPRRGGARHAPPRIRPRAVARQPSNAAVSRRRSQRSRMAPTRARAPKRRGGRRPASERVPAAPAEQARGGGARQHGAPLSPDLGDARPPVEALREIARGPARDDGGELLRSQRRRRRRLRPGVERARQRAPVPPRQRPRDDRPRAAARGGAVQPPVERRRQPRVRVAREEARQRGPPAPHLRRGVAPRVEGADDGAAAPPLEHVRHHQSGATRESRVIRPRRERRG